MTERPAGLTPAVEHTAVPFFPQDRYQCGPAALATVLAARGRSVTPDELVDEVYGPDRQGSLRPEMRAAARARGLVAYPVEPTLEALLRTVSDGRPVLVMQNLGLSWLPRWHYAVAVGYDLDTREIVLRSGRQKRRVTGLDTFERTWARSGHWAQVITTPTDPPATANPLTWLQAVHELEATGQTGAALSGYRTATQRWPRTPAAWLSRGTAAYGADEPAEARTALRRAVELAPEDAAGWNNLAYALAATGALDAGIDAARCATRLAPDKDAPRATLKELRTRESSSTDAAAELPRCPAP